MTGPRTLLACALSLLLLACADPASSPLPWREGGRAAGAWTVHTSEPRPQSLRLSLRQEGRTAGVEIVACPGQGDPWCSPRFRVQPAPGEAPSELLLSSLLTELRAWDLASEGAWPFADARIEPARAGAPWAWALLAAALVFLALIGARARLVPEERRLILGVALSLAALVVWTALALHGRWLPADRVALFHAGGSGWTIDQLYGFGSAGPVFGALVAQVGGGAYTLQRVATLNLGLTGAALILLFAVGRVASGGRWLPLVAAALYGLMSTTRHAALSELAAPLLVVLFLMSVILHDLGRRAPGRGLALTSALALGLLTGLAAGMRVETLALGLPALLLLGARIAAGEARAARWAATSLRWLRARCLGSGWRRAAIAALVIGWGLTLRAFVGDPAWGQAGWALAGMDPLRPVVLSLPLALGMMMPLGLGVMLCVGLIRGLLRPRATGGLAYGVVALAQVCLMDARGSWVEAARHLTLILPPLMVLGLAAWPASRTWAARAWPRWGWPTRGVVILMGAASAAPVASWPARARPLSLWGSGSACVGAAEASELERDVPRALRFLARAVDDHPGCVLVAPVLPGDRPPWGGRGADRGGASAWRPWGWKLFGAPLDAPLDLPMDGRPDLRAWRRRIQADCWLLYRGLDLHLVGPDEPTPWAGDLPLVSREAFRSRPRELDGSCGHHDPAIRLELRELLMALPSRFR
jgi:hypothetical protein